MDELITLKKNEPVCSSLDVATKFEKKHKNVLKKIEQILAENQPAQNGARCFMKSNYIDEKGEERPMYFMNRDGFTFLAMGFTGKEANKWKWEYINAFNNMEKLLIEKSTTLWLQTREQAKIERKEETNAIQKFVEYAKENGSGKADMYYKHFSSLANKTVGITDRDLASVVQLNTLTLTERVIAIKILEGLQNKIEYHQLYQEIKEHLKLFNQIAYLT